MATVPGALLLCISSPYARRGALWQAYTRHYGQDGDATLVWQAPTHRMNPLVDEQVIADAYAADEAAAAAEYGAEFRRDIESFVSREAIEAVVIPGRRELPPMSGTQYVAFVDPSGGSHDSFTLAVGHSERRGERIERNDLGAIYRPERHTQELYVLDAIREQKPPFSPADVVQEFCELLQAYRITSVEGDRYAGEWPREQFRRHGIEYRTAEKVRSDLYHSLLPLLNSGAVELLDAPRLIAQLLGLERRTGRSGKDSIDHGPRGHDDVVNAAAGALITAARPAARWTVRPLVFG